VPSKRPDDWADEALCLRARPGLFFSLDEDDVAEALSLCRRCHVRGACLSYAITHGERFGVWGGTTERERRRMIRDVQATPSTRHSAA